MENEERVAGLDASDPPWTYRGRDLSRTLAFSDGIFAFAATLLVLDLVLPAHVVTSPSGLEPYLTGSTFLGAAFAYAITFFVITLWWMGHHLIFGYLKRFDRPMVRLNGVFLLFIALLPFATLVLTNSGTNPAGVCFFAGVQVAAGCSLGGLWLYAVGPGRLVAKGFPDEWRTYVTSHTFSTPVVFGLSIPIALLDINVGAVNIAELFWLGVFIVPVAWRSRQGTPGKP